MAISPTKVLLSVENTNVKLVAPVSVVSAWATVIDAGGMDAADAETITNPDTGITASDHHYCKRGGRAGTTLLVRMGYEGTPSTDPAIKVFGRGSSSDPWMVLPSVATTISNTLTTNATTDVTDGTYKYTAISTATRFDCLGCEEFLIGVETAYAVSAGSAATAFLQAKLV